MDATTTVADCGHDTHHEGPGTGYARLVNPREWQGVTLPADAKVCYACSDAMQREDMANASEFFAYVDSDGKHITTWSGGELAKVTHLHTRKHWTPTGGEYETAYLDCVDSAGARWYGRGPGKGMYVRIRRNKV